MQFKFIAVNPAHLNGEAQTQLLHGRRAPMRRRFNSCKIRAGFADVP